MSSLGPSSNLVMPKRWSFTSSHSMRKRSAIHGKNTASMWPERAAKTWSTTSSGTCGWVVGTGVSHKGPRLGSAMVGRGLRPSKASRRPRRRGTAKACAGMLITEGSVGGLRKHPYGRVDQLEDRYLGMVEAPSSNLGTSTSLQFNDVNEVDCAAKTEPVSSASIFGSAPPLPQ